MERIMHSDGLINWINDTYIFPIYDTTTSRESNPNTVSERYD